MNLTTTPILSIQLPTPFYIRYYTKKISMYDRLNVHNFNTYFNFDNDKHYIKDKI